MLLVLSGFLALALVLVAPETWLATLTGFIGLDPQSGSFTFLPMGADFFLIGAFAAYSGAGGVINLMLSNWAHDKAYGMAAHAGYIPAAADGEWVELAHTGFRFRVDAEALARWRGWWRIVRADRACTSLARSSEWPYRLRST